MAWLLRAYSTALRKHPLVVQSLQAGTLLAIGDATSQFAIERRSWQQFEGQRTVRFFLIGSLMAGPITSKWYTWLNANYGSSIVKKLLLDQTLYGPLIVTLLMSFNAFMKGKRGQEVGDLVMRDLPDVVLTGWMVWPAVQVVNFSFVPAPHQVLVVQVTAYFWNTYLAWKINRARVEKATLE